MLCCLIGAFFAGALFAAWRIVVAATKSGVASWVWQGALIGAVALVPFAAAVADYSGRHRDALAATTGEPPCFGEEPASGR